MLCKRELINSFETIGYSCCIMVSIVIGPKRPFLPKYRYHVIDVDWDRLYYR